MYVLGIDPGKTTGVCLLERIDFDLDENKWDIKVHYAKQLTWDERTSIEQDLEHAKTLSAYVVVERFTLRPTYTAAQDKTLPAMNMIGVIEGIMWRLQYPEDLYVMQPASHRKSARLLPGHGKQVKGPHARDAYRHARYYIVTKSNRQHQVSKAVKRVKGIE